MTSKIKEPGGKKGTRISRFEGYPLELIIFNFALPANDRYTYIDETLGTARSSGIILASADHATAALYLY